MCPFLLRSYESSNLHFLKFLANRIFECHLGRCLCKLGLLNAEIVDSLELLRFACQFFLSVALFTTG